MREKRIALLKGLDAQAALDVLAANNRAISQDLFIKMTEVEDGEDLSRFDGIVVPEADQLPADIPGLVYGTQPLEDFLAGLPEHVDWTYMDEPDIVDVQVSGKAAPVLLLLNRVNQIYGGRGFYLRGTAAEDGDIRVLDQVLDWKGRQFAYGSETGLLFLVLLLLKVENLWFMRIDAEDGKLTVNHKPLFDLASIPLFARFAPLTALKGELSVARKDLETLRQDGDYAALYAAGEKVEALTDELRSLESALMDAAFLVLKAEKPGQEAAVSAFLEGDAGKALDLLSDSEADRLQAARILAVEPGRDEEIAAIYDACFSEPAAYEWFGWLCKKEDFSGALEILSRLEQTGTADRAKLQLNRAKALDGSGDATGALAALTESLEGTDLSGPSLWLAQAWILSARLNKKLGNYEEAAQDYQEALMIEELLVQKVPVAYETALADTWYELGVLQGETGRFSEAEQTLDKGLEIREGLAQKDPDVYEPGLAKSWNDIGALYVTAGRFQSAKEPHLQSLEIWKRLAGKDFDKFGPDLARTWNNLGILYRNTGRYPEAQSAFKTSMDLWNHLAGNHDEDIASDWNNLGILLRDTGRFDEAETAFQKALAMRQKMAQADPRAYQSQLATSWNNLGNFYRDRGQYDKALSAYQDCLAFVQDLAEGNPGAFEPNVASCWNNLGNLYKDMGQNEEALDAYLKSLGIRERLAGKNPRVYEPGLATTWNNLGVLYSLIGLKGKSEEAQTKCLDLRKRLAKRNPGVYDPDLAASWFNLGNLHVSEKKFQTAEMEYSQALNIWQDLANTDPEVHEPNLAAGWYNLAILHHSAGRNEEAVEAFEQSRALYAKLAERDPDRFEPRLGRTVNALNDIRRMETERVEKEEREAENRKVRAWNAPIKKEISALYSQLAQVEQELAALSKFSFKTMFGAGSKKQELEQKRQALLAEVDRLRNELMVEA